MEFVIYLHIEVQYTKVIIFWLLPLGDDKLFDCAIFDMPCLIWSDSRCNNCRHLSTRSNPQPIHGPAQLLATHPVMAVFLWVARGNPAITRDLEIYGNIMDA